MSAGNDADAGDDSEQEQEQEQDDAGGPGRREVAWRLFAAEFDDADYSYSESDEERAPNYVVTPTGARVNRLFVVGVLTEIEQVSEDYLRARVVDPTGAFVVYAGQYQPDALAFLERTDPPAFVAVTGKARTFQPDDSQRVYTSVRPESINAVDAETRDRWVVRTAERTLDRVAAAADALGRPERGEDLTAALRESGVPDGLATGIPLALDHYGTTETYLGALRDLALDAARVVAGTREEVEPLDVAPGEGGDVDADLTAGAATSASAAVAGEAAGAGAAPDDESEAGSEAEPTSESEPEPVPQPESGAGTEPEAPASTADAESEAVEPGARAGDAVESESEAGAAETLSSESETAVEEPAGGETAETDERTEATEAESAESAEAGSKAASEPGAETGVEAGTEEAAETDEMYEFDEEERRQVEEEHGLEFSTGAEVEGGEDSGAADIDAEIEPGAERETGAEVDSEPAGESVPDEEFAETGTGTETASAPGDELGDFEPGLGDEATAPEESGIGAEDETAEAGTGVEPEPDTEIESEPEPESGPETTEDVDVDLEDAVVEAMEEIGGSDGADREAVIERVVERHGVDPEAAEEAIQDALMSGRCYESGDGEITPI